MFWGGQGSSLAMEALRDSAAGDVPGRIDCSAAQAIGKCRRDRDVPAQASLGTGPASVSPATDRQMNERERERESE